MKISYLLNKYNNGVIKCNDERIDLNYFSSFSMHSDQEYSRYGFLWLNKSFKNTYRHYIKFTAKDPTNLNKPSDAFFYFKNKAELLRKYNDLKNKIKLVPAMWRGE